MNQVIAFIGQQEGFVFRNISFDGLQLVLSYLIIVGFVITLLKPKFKRLTFLLIGIVAFQSWTVSKQARARSKEHLILAHETANTLLFKQEATNLEVFGKLTTYATRIMKDYETGEGIDSVSIATLKNSYSVKDKSLYLMDSLGIYPQQQQLDYLVLTQSPKINLNRLLDSIRIKKVVVDGSNYKSYIARWKATCLKRKLPFHYTGEKGAFYFE